MIYSPWLVLDETQEYWVTEDSQFIWAWAQSVSEFFTMFRVGSLVRPPVPHRIRFYAAPEPTDQTHTMTKSTLAVKSFFSPESMLVFDVMYRFILKEIKEHGICHLGMEQVYLADKCTPSLEVRDVPR